VHGAFLLAFALAGLAGVVLSFTWYRRLPPREPRVGSDLPQGIERAVGERAV
jgi:hypothetical protein